MPSTTDEFQPTGPTETATVLRVIDGDTIEVELDGWPRLVRYIGVDAPETVHPRRPVQWMGPEAAATNAAMVGGRSVLLERDVSDVDHLGRLLRYVWIRDPRGPWILVNLEMIRLGLARVVTYPPDVKYVEELFLPAQRAAREEGIGIWSR